MWDLPYVLLMDLVGNIFLAQFELYFQCNFHGLEFSMGFFRKYGVRMGNVTRGVWSFGGVKLCILAVLLKVLSGCDGCSFTLCSCSRASSSCPAKVSCFFFGFWMF